MDEPDAFCISRSRAQEHDAVRRAMTTLMLELDKLHPSTTIRLLVFGITNVPNLVDTAVVRRFALKQSVDVHLSWDEFNSYLSYLNKPIEYKPNEEELQKLYYIYKSRKFTTGDIKALYKILFVDVTCANIPVNILDRLVELFEKGFSTRDHLFRASEELSNA